MRVGRRFAHYSEVAQLVEHPAVNRQVAGSSPAFGAIFLLGELSERSKEHDWKSCRRLITASRVQIPYSPPLDSIRQQSILARWSSG